MNISLVVTLAQGNAHGSDHLLAVNSRKHDVLASWCRQHLQLVLLARLQLLPHEHSECANNFVQEGAKRHRGSSEVSSLCELPFVLTPEAKGRIFTIEAALQMHAQVHSFSINVRPHFSFLTSLEDC